MKKTSKKHQKKLIKKINKKKIIFALVLLVVVYFLFKPKKDVLQDWEEMFGVSPEGNPDNLSFEEWNILQPEVYRHDPEILARLRDCPFSRAAIKDPDTMDIFNDGTTCNRDTHVETGNIYLKNHDFEQGVKEFKAWLKKNKLKLGKDVIVEDFYPWDYKEVCNTPKIQLTSALEEFSCLSKLEINCLVNEDHEVTEEWVFKVKKASSIDACKKKVYSSYDFDEDEKVVFIQEK